MYYIGDGGKISVNKEHDIQLTNWNTANVERQPVFGGRLVKMNRAHISQ